MRRNPAAIAAIILLAATGALSVGWNSTDPATSIRIGPYYQCLTTYRPFDIAFAPDGMLFSSDATSWLLYMHDPACRQIVGVGTAGWITNVTGVAVDNQERICFSGIAFRSRSILFPSEVFILDYQPEAWCWTTAPAMHRLPDLETDEMYAYHYTFGMASLDGLLFLASWDVSSAPGNRAIIVIDQGQIVDEVLLDSWFPLFIHPISATELLVTALTGVTPAVDTVEMIHPAEGGAVLHIRDGAVRVVVDGLRYPTGIVATDAHLYVGDYLTGEIHVFSHSGELLNSVGGFRGPMGMARAPNGDICVAEMDGSLIRCMSATDFAP